MSRVGKQPITVPAGVTITADKNTITVTGPKGSLTQFTMPGISVEQVESQILVTRKSDIKEHRSKHGLMRSLVANMVQGVTEGFTKNLELNGVGYRIALNGDILKLSVGFSHDIEYKVPQGIKIDVEANKMAVTGINKQQVGQVAAEIRSIKKPEPYKGKGIKYADERIIRKSGKSGKE